MKTYLNLKGLTCQKCVKSVTDALIDIDGVLSVKVVLERQSATIEHEESVDSEDLIAAIKSVGFEAHR